MEYQKFREKVKRKTRRNKNDELDDFETEYIDMDELLKLYLDEFRSIKNKHGKMLLDNFKQEVHSNDFDGDAKLNWLTFKNIYSIITKFKEDRTFKASGMLKEAQASHYLRALLYAFMCGDNGNDISDKEFLAACNRFGIDNPMPVMSQRLYFFGNNETAQSVLEAAYKKHNEAPFFDPEHFCG